MSWLVEDAYGIGITKWAIRRQQQRTIAYACTEVSDGGSQTIDLTSNPSVSLHYLPNGLGGDRDQWQLIQSSSGMMNVKKSTLL